jgi:hypothetical protein
MSVYERRWIDEADINCRSCSRRKELAVNADERLSVFGRNCAQPAVFHRFYSAQSEESRGSSRVEPRSKKSIPGIESMGQFAGRKNQIANGSGMVVRKTGFTTRATGEIFFLFPRSLILSIEFTKSTSISMETYIQHYMAPFSFLEQKEERERKI